MNGRVHTKSVIQSDRKGHVIREASVLKDREMPPARTPVEDRLDTFGIETFNMKWQTYFTSQYKDGTALRFNLVLTNPPSRIV